MKRINMKRTILITPLAALAIVFSSCSDEKQKQEEEIAAAQREYDGLRGLWRAYSDTLDNSYKTAVKDGTEASPEYKIRREYIFQKHDSITLLLNEKRSEINRLKRKASK